VRIELPWPAENQRRNKEHLDIHARRESNSRAFYDGKMATYEGLGRQRGIFENGIPLRVKIAFVPPDNRSRDQDNGIAMLKHYLDGIAFALEVDDKNFKLEKALWMERDTEKKGKIILEIDYAPQTDDDTSWV